MFEIDFEFELGHLENGVWFPKEFGQDNRIDIKFSVINNTAKKISMIEIDLYPIENDKKLSWYDLMLVQKTVITIKRPLYPNQTYSSYFENMWFNESIVKVFAYYANVFFYNSDLEDFRVSKIAYIK